MSEVLVTPQSVEQLERFETTAGMLSWLSSCDHKQIGILYLLTALAFFIVGGCEALLMRLQLAFANNHLLGPEAYDQLFTLHGTTMIFLVVMPTLLGLSVYFLPLMIGARDMAFPRLVNSFLMVFALPVLNAALVMLLIDRNLHARFFTPDAGGSPILWQHFFWSFGHPEVYIMVLPAFGIISEVIPVFSRKPIFGYGFVAASTVAIALLSFAVWAHHMFAVGLGHSFDMFFAFGSMLIAIPTGIKIFNWIFTMWKGAIRFTTSMKFAVAFLIEFTIGGLSGVVFATVPMDWQLTDSYVVVAHIHYVLFGGTMFAVFAGIYYWWPKMTGRLLSERLGTWHFWLTVIGFNAAFFVQHMLGIAGMPRRVWTYPALPHWQSLNLISTVGAFVLGISTLFLFWNFLWSRKRGMCAGENPWEAWTLEWATPSPPPVYNFAQIPPVYGPRPLWDLKHPDQRDRDLNK